MVIFKHEMKQTSKLLIVWSLTIALLVLFVIMFFPEMKHSMGDFNKMFGNLGEFTKMFGLDQLNMSTLIGFYGLEIGNILGIGGALFAAILGVGMLSKEEDNHTAEFLGSHPITRFSILIQKYVAMLLQIIILNGIVVIVSLLSVMLIKEQFPMSEFIQYHIACLLMQLQIGSMAFAISAFLKRNSFGLGIGLAIVFYFLNLISKLSNNTKFLKFLTPFYYADSANVIQSNSIDWWMVGCGYGFVVLILILGFVHYCHKDLAS